nr:uncharacterized protein LOC109428159 [Aedes albopictus]
MKPSKSNQISWIRRRDWHILSSGAQMYTNDERFAILHTPGSNTWTLQIKFVQRRDHGTYECQSDSTTTNVSAAIRFSSASSTSTSFEYGQLPISDQNAVSSRRTYHLASLPAVSVYIYCSCLLRCHRYIVGTETPMLFET